MADDEHLARLVAGLRTHREGPTSGSTTAEHLLTAVRLATDALDHAHPQWKHPLEHLALDLDGDLHPWNPSAPHGDRGAALRALDDLDRAATGRGSPTDRPNGR